MRAILIARFVAENLKRLALGDRSPARGGDPPVERMDQRIFERPGKADPVRRSHRVLDLTSRGRIDDHGGFEHRSAEEAKITTLVRREKAIEARDFGLGIDHLAGGAGERIAIY